MAWVTVTLAEGAEQETVTQAIQDSVDSYLRAAALEAYRPAIGTDKSYTISYARIGAAILATDGVADYEGLKVSGGTVNLTIPAKYAAVLGEVSVSYD